MQKLIDTSSASFGSGLASQRKLFRVKTGQCTGRLIAIYPKTTGTIVFSWSDPPYSAWAAPTNIVTDAADFPSSAWMDKDNNVYVAYTVATTFALKMVKLSYSNGTWAVGAVQSIYNNDQNYHPFIFKDKIDRLWVVWSRFITASSDYRIQVKSSTNDGATWGTGPTDPGTALSSAGSSAYGQLIALGEKIYAFYTIGGTTTALRSFDISGAVWSAEQVAYSGTGLSSDFHAATSADQKIGLLFNSSAGLLFKEYDGTNFSGQFTVDAAPTTTPQLVYFQSTPYALFAKNIGTDQNRALYAYRNGSNFTAAQALFGDAVPFVKVFCYDQSAVAKFADRTTEAGNTAAADVFHPTSGGLVKDPQDALYVGLDVPFNQIAVLLSTTGIAGQVIFSYWDGSAWVEFTPDSGAYHFATSPALVRLWPDLESVPATWRKSAVNSSVQFWIKIEVQTAFTTVPVGTQITAVPNLKYLSAGG